MCVLRKGPGHSGFGWRCCARPQPCIFSDKSRPRVASTPACMFLLWNRCHRALNTGWRSVRSIQPSSHSEGKKQARASHSHRASINGNRNKSQTMELVVLVSRNLDSPELRNQSQSCACKNVARSELAEVKTSETCPANSRCVYMSAPVSARGEPSFYWH